METWFIIPARKDSKGVPFKNRKLFSYTAETIPKSKADRVIVTTDDELLYDEAERYGFRVSRRSGDLADDHASMKEVLLDVVRRHEIGPDDTVVLLYLTYPQRTWEDITGIMDFYRSKNAVALSCCVDIADHPYLCFEKKDDDRGVSVIEHSLYRRQDYPDCFRLSLFVAIFKASKISELNNLLVCPETIFYKLPKQVIDIDNEIDLINFHNGNGS